MKFKIHEDASALEKVVILGLPKDLDQLKNLHTVNERELDHLKDLRQLGIIRSEFGKVSSTLYEINQQQHRFVTVGLGEGNYQLHHYQQIFGKLFQYLKKEEISKASILLASFSSTSSDLEELSEILGLQSERAIYEGALLQTPQQSAYQLELIVHTSQQEVKQAIHSGQIIGRGINQARQLSHLPPNYLTPKHYANRIEKMFAETNVDVEVMNGATLREKGFGLIDAVGKGSVHPPHLVTLTYNGASDNQAPIALVGKGVTYDSGGYSIKSKMGMQAMKYDMCGSANVVEMIDIAQQLELPVNLVGVLALAENMVSDRSMKPDDVYQALSGETVEVLNTDAEGRLVLGDAVYYAAQLKPRYILDFATLTGAAVVALGEDKGAVFKNNDQTPLDSILATCARVNEPIFELPITNTERQKIKKSDIADLVNHTNGHGKALFAAGFISHFAGKIPHLHFDIAGPATVNHHTYNGSAGPTGFLILPIVKWLREASF